MKKVKILQDVKGSINGRDVKDFKAGYIYKVDGIDISVYLADAWVNKRMAEYVIEEKAIVPQYENKAIEPEREIKKAKKAKGE